MARALAGMRTAADTEAAEVKIPEATQAHWVQIELVAERRFTHKTMLRPNSLHMNSLYNTQTLYCLLLQQDISLPVCTFLAATA